MVYSRGDVVFVKGDSYDVWGLVMDVRKNGGLVVNGVSSDTSGHCTFFGGDSIEVDPGTVDPDTVKEYEDVAKSELLSYRDSCSRLRSNSTAKINCYLSSTDNKEQAFKIGASVCYRVGDIVRWGIVRNIDSQTGKYEVVTPYTDNPRYSGIGIDTVDHKNIDIESTIRHRSVIKPILFEYLNEMEIIAHRTFRHIEGSKE